MFNKSIFKKPIFWIAFILGIAALYFGFRFFAGYIPITDLKTEKLAKEKQEWVKSKFEDEIYPGGWKFPAYSPNEKYYINLVSSRIKFRNAEELLLYESENNKLLGNYSYKNLIIYGWDDESDGLYIQDYDAGQGSIAILLEKPSKYGPMKKIFVPE